MYKSYTDFLLRYTRMEYFGGSKSRMLEAVGMRNMYTKLTRVEKGGYSHSLLEKLLMLYVKMDWSLDEPKRQFRTWVETQPKVEEEKQGALRCTSTLILDDMALRLNDLQNAKAMNAAKTGMARTVMKGMRRLEERFCIQAVNSATGCEFGCELIDDAYVASTRCPCRHLYKGAMMLLPPTLS